MEPFSHRFVAAFLAISARCSGVKFRARAAPPFLPRAAAFGSFPVFPAASGASGFSPVAICLPSAAGSVTLVRRCLALGPIGIWRNVHQRSDQPQQSLMFRAFRLSVQERAQL